ncbi:DUF397 domain-containing protein [Streptomyces aidingensis]|uniref:DUF397 domain-containing protein n=1 Tax=Streptomyces aidingensis TaxID=910347 RepID=A0A1I1RBB9_9ACTN|nr:DUF397 domain-containing protein [Streptomyces aidingensis]SFD31555.1 protein of unknown function [Streptomyces aidingensis]
MFEGVPFRTSSHSTDDCVAVARAPRLIGVADTKVGNARVIAVRPDAWTVFVAAVTTR